MQRKIGITEGLGWFIAILTMFAALGLARHVVEHNFDVIMIFAFILLWTQSALMLAGLIHIKSTSMRMIKWINIVECILFVLALIYIATSDTEQINPLVKYMSISYLTIVLVIIIFIAYVNHRLDQFYTEIRKTRSGAVLVIGIVCEGPVSIPPAVQQRIPEPVPAEPNLSI